MILLIIMIVMYPFKIKWSFHINLLENVGFVVFKVLFIRLLCERFKINSKCEFEIEREKKKNKNKNSQIFFQGYIYNLAKLVDVKSIDMFTDIGYGDDAYFVSMLTGCVEASLMCLFSLFLNKYKSVKIFNKSESCYEKDVLMLTGKIIVSFNLMAVFVSLFNAYKYYRNQKENVHG